MTSDKGERSWQLAGQRGLLSTIGLIAGPLLAGVVLLLLPDQYLVDEQAVEFAWAGRATLAMMVWMSVWWLTEAVNVTVTSLLPLATFPLLHIATIGETAAPYAHRLIFLYMGGFFLALAMQRWGLGKRLALHTIQMVGTSPRRVIAGFMLTTAVFSAFVSNTATAVMMVAIASNLTTLGAPGSQGKPSGFATCLMLAIAYSASLGGVATIIGTPPNTFLVGFLRDSIDPAYQLEISFFQWMMIGVPVSLCLLPCAYATLLMLFRVDDCSLLGQENHIEKQLSKLGRMNPPEWIVLSVFSITVALWIFSKALKGVALTIDSNPVYPFQWFSDEAIVMTTSFLLFVIPAGRGWRKGQEQPDCPRDYFVLEWPVAQKLPWGILLLFGGGLTLAAAVKQHSVAEFLAAQTATLDGVPVWILVLGVTAAVVFLTELTSNAATTASLVPILAAVAPSLGLHPYLLIFPATFAASCAFMLPVATPPNAIVFGTGAISTGQMARAGLLLNLLAIAIIGLLTWLWIWPQVNL